MVREEKTGIRSLAYSYWHRTLTRKCTVVNLDWIECRWKYSPKHGKRMPMIVAIIEDKHDKYGGTAWISDTQKRVMIQLSESLGVPAYLVTHNVEMTRQDYNKHYQMKSQRNIFWLPDTRKDWQFRITDIITGESDIMDEGEYRKWIESL